MLLEVHIQRFFMVQASQYILQLNRKISRFLLPDLMKKLKKSKQFRFHKKSLKMQKIIFSANGLSPLKQMPSRPAIMLTTEFWGLVLTLTKECEKRLKLLRQNN